MKKSTKNRKLSLRFSEKRIQDTYNAYFNFYYDFLSLINIAGQSRFIPSFQEELKKLIPCPDKFESNSYKYLKNLTLF